MRVAACFLLVACSQGPTVIYLLQPDGGGGAKEPFQDSSPATLDAGKPAEPSTSSPDAAVAPVPTSSPTVPPTPTVTAAPTPPAPTATVPPVRPPIDAGVAYDPCPDYCLDTMRICIGDQQQYGSYQECVVACGDMDQRSDQTMNGNWVGCRRRYAIEAENRQKPAYCNGAGLLSAANCNWNGIAQAPDYCTPFCQLAIKECQNDGYPRTEDACIQECKHWPMGTVGDKTGNTMQCRVTQIQQMYRYGVSNIAYARSMQCPKISGAETCK